MDVYAATLVSTTAAPQSAVVHFEAVGTDFNSLFYSIVAGPSHGTLGTISGSTLSYTPTNAFLGIDSSTYKATLGSGNSSTKTATITVFGAFLDAPQQFGKNLSGATINNYSGSSVSLSSNGKILIASRQMAKYAFMRILMPLESTRQRY